MERRIVPTGISIALPVGFEGQVRPRSGLAARHGVTVANAPGTIDADYRGEVGVILINLGKEPFRITRGMRIAQLVVARGLLVEAEAVDLVEIGADLERRHVVDGLADHRLVGCRFTAS